MARRSEFGTVRDLDSGRWQARYSHEGGRYTARAADGTPTFDTKRDALKALARVRLDIEAGTWTQPPKRSRKGDPPSVARLTFRVYAGTWLAERDLAVRTRSEYARLLKLRINPTFGDGELTEITPAKVRAWHSGQGTEDQTARAQAYSLLRTILGTAVSDDLIPANPCHIRGASRAKTTRKIRPATLTELAAIVEKLPDRYRAMALLACWCSLRFGELTALTRGDVDVKAGVVRVRRAAAYTQETGIIVKAPKSEAGVRDVTIPSHILPALKAHLRDHAQPGKDGLVFPSATGGHMGSSAWWRVYRPAREAAGRPDLTFHALRHTGQTYAAMAGANLRELMARAGQSSPGAALRYLHEIDGRQREIADALATYATGPRNAAPITTPSKRAKRVKG